MITFRCGRCSILMQAQDRHAGRGVTCKQCQHVTTCPKMSILVPLRPEPKSRPVRKVGNPGFLAAMGAIGVVCVVLAIVLH